MSPQIINELLKDKKCEKCGSEDVACMLYGVYTDVGKEYWQRNCKVIFPGRNDNENRHAFSCNACKSTWQNEKEMINKLMEKILTDRRK
jgi:hypothetical protein